MPSQPPTVEVVDESRYWVFAGRRRPVSDYGEPVAHLDDLARCTATDLQAALRRSRDRHWHGTQLFISDGPGPDADVEDGPVGPVSFTLTEGRLTLCFLHFTDEYLDNDDEIFTRTQRVLAPLLARHRMWLVAAENDESVRVGPWIVNVELGFHTRRRMIVDLVQVGLDSMALLDAVTTGVFGREQVGDLLRSGHAEALVGQPEGEWLEAKRQHYDLTTTAGKIALAKSVARFANAEQGGLVVVGLETSSTTGQDVIKRVRPMAPDSRIVRRYQQVLEQRLYPPPAGLRIEPIKLPAGDLVLIDVPPQPEDLKPFLVHGAVVEGRTEDAFISIVRRRGDSSIPTTAPMIHATLAAGRALLRRGQLPPTDTEQGGQGPPNK